MKYEIGYKEYFNSETGNKRKDLEYLLYVCPNNPGEFMGFWGGGRHWSILYYYDDKEWHFDNIGHWSTIEKATR